MLFEYFHYPILKRFLVQFLNNALYNFLKLLFYILLSKWNSLNLNNERKF